MCVQKRPRPLCCRWKIFVSNKRKLPKSQFPILIFCTLSELKRRCHISNMTQINFNNFSNNVGKFPRTTTRYRELHIDSFIFKNNFYTISVPGTPSTLNKYKSRDGERQKKFHNGLFGNRKIALIRDAVSPIFFFTSFQRFDSVRLVRQIFKWINHFRNTKVIRPRRTYV